MMDDFVNCLRVNDRERCRKQMAKSFFKMNQRIMRLKFELLPVEARIELWISVLPDVVCGLFEHQRPLGKVWEWSALHEHAWITLLKSTCTELRMELEIDVRVVTVSCY